MTRITIAPEDHGKPDALQKAIDRAFGPRRGFASPGFEQGKYSEHDVLDILTKLARDWPSHLWLFAGGGSLHIMQTLPDGKRAMRAGAVDPDYRIASVTIPCDGGDW